LSDDHKADAHKLTDATPDFKAPAFFNVVKHLRGHEASSYLIALTALMDGMNVEFYRSQLEADFRHRFFNFEFSGANFFKVSSGGHHRHFLGSQSDTLGKAEVENARDKLLTKRILHQHNLNTPFGGGATAERLETLKLMMDAGVPRVVVKPMTGSLAKGVVLNLVPSAAAAHISRNPLEKFIVEQQIVGSEYRVYVVGKQAVGAFCRVPQHVVGDGVSTIKALLQAKAKSRSQNPLFIDKNIDFELAERALRRRHGHLDRVPSYGEVVGLATDTLLNDAGDRNYALDTIPCEALDLCVKAAKALMLPNAGFDVIIDQRGTPFILEANARAMISLHSFPHPVGRWNLEVPRAILRHFLPAPTSAPKVITSFDFISLRKELLREGRSSRGVNAADFATFG
jgi:D-alanine-D-alanine ligase-like ATP-grasp enzyme